MRFMPICNQRAQYFTILIFSLLFISFDSNAQNVLDVRCGANEITCAIEEFPRDLYETSSSQGGSLNCRGIDLFNPLWYQFTAVPGDITITGTTTRCEPTPGAVSMQVWTLCAGGFNNPECVIGSTCESTVSGYLWNPQQLWIPDGLLEVGQIYYLAVGDCEGKDCEYFIEIEATPFDIPPLLSGDVQLTTQECTSNLPPFKYCGGADLRFTVDHPSYEAIGGEWYWSINELDGNADASSVTWSANINSGTGNPIRNGRFPFRQLGSNWIDMSFTVPGLYEICIDEVQTNCGHYVGPLCQEIEIIVPEPELFSEYDICYSHLLNGPWEGPGFDTLTGLTWNGGNIFLSDFLTASVNEDDFFEITKFTSPDGCNCVYEQTVLVNILGEDDFTEVELMLTECQLPYTWFDQTIFELDEFFQEEIVLEGASGYVNYKNKNCDSIVVLTISEYELLPNVFQSDCTEEGKEFSFDLEGTELQGAEFFWEDAETGIAVTPNLEDPATILPTGSYNIFVFGFIPDVNHNEGSVGTTPLSFIQCSFGPFEVFNPIPLDPVVTPYDTFLCSNQLENVFFKLDTLQDSISYTWIIPESIMDETTISENNDSVMINTVEGLGPNDTIRVVAYVECGRSDTVNVPLVILQDAVAPEFEDREGCVNLPLEITYPYNPGAEYIWDFGPGIVDGNTSDGSPFTVTYSEVGNYTYTLSVSDSEGCVVGGGPYQIDIFEAPPIPEIVCIDQSDPTTLVFEWNEDPDYEYTVSASSSTGQFGTLSGNQYIFTDLPPQTTATVAVIAMGEGPVECNSSVAQLSCATIGCDIPPLDLGNFAPQSFCQNDPDNQAVQFNIIPPAGVTGDFSGPGISEEGLLDPNSIELSNPGNYEINYNYLEESTGCAETLTIVITIYPEIVVESFSVPSFCPDDIVFLLPQISNVDLNNLTYNWIPYDVTDPSIEFPQTGYNEPGNYMASFHVLDESTQCEKTIDFQYTIKDSIEVTEFKQECNDNGTPQDFTDDYYEIFINADSKEGGASGSFIVFNGGTELGTFNYGTGGNFELPASSDYILNIEDADDNLCATELSIEFLEPCEPVCEIQSSTVLLCNDNDTADEADDFYDIRVLAFVMNPGPSDMFNITINGEFQGAFPYTGGGVIQYPAVGQVELILVDVDEPECINTSTINLTPCSSERYDCPTSAIHGLGIKTPIKGFVKSNTNDNLVAQRYSLNPGDDFTGLSVLGTRDSNKQICFADSSSFEVTFYNDESGLPGDITSTFTMFSVADSIDTYTDANTNEERILVNYTFDFEQIIDQNAGWFSVANMENDCSFNWVWGTDSPTTGGAVTEGGIWMPTHSFNFCLFYEYVNTVNIDFNDLLIYPNPTDQILYIENIKKIKKLSLVNILGQSLQSMEDPSGQITIDMKGQANGVYILLFEHENGDLYSHKITKL